MQKWWMKLLLNSFGLLRSRVALSIIEELWKSKEMSKMSVKSEYDQNWLCTQVQATPWQYGHQTIGTSPL